jgi:hypothetical protein
MKDSDSSTQMGKQDVDITRDTQNIPELYIQFIVGVYLITAV